MKVGIDVGGTHTDAVLMDGDRVVAWHKAATSTDILAGVRAALEVVLDINTKTATGPSRGDLVTQLTIGTTQFTNAVISRQGLSRVAAIRISLPTGRAVPPMAGWPLDIKQAIAGGEYWLEGGHEVDGREIAPLRLSAVREAALQILDSGVGNVVVTAVFSPMNPAMELEAAQEINAVAPSLDVTCSHQLGGLGLLERENAALLNASLRPLASSVIAAFEQGVREIGLDVPVFISQNDGTLMQASRATIFPVLTFSSGPTNSMRGAAWLSGLSDAIVIDVGGTTADVGMLSGGFPRQSNTTIEVGGVRTNFRMPDMMSLGVGGGSLVRKRGESVGPDSVGHRLSSEALVFGGTTMTLTDIAVAAGLAEIGDAKLLSAGPDSQGQDTLDQDTIRRALDQVQRSLSMAVDRIKTSQASLPVLAVGGGAFLVPEGMFGVSELVRSDFSSVANAIGATLAQISGEAELIYKPDEVSREQALEQVTAAATEDAVGSGASRESVEVVEVVEVPLSYMSEPATHLTVRTVGDLLF